MRSLQTERTIGCSICASFLSTFGLRLCGEDLALVLVQTNGRKRPERSYSNLQDQSLKRGERETSVRVGSCALILQEQHAHGPWMPTKQ